MPWSINTVSKLRNAFVHAVRSAGQPVATTARDYGISRETACKRLARFDVRQPLCDFSRRPHHSPTRTTGSAEATVLALRDQFGWAPRTIVAYLRTQGQSSLPARTAAAILRRHGRIGPHRRAFVADGSAYNWSFHSGYFADFEPFVDFMHVRCYVSGDAVSVDGPSGWSQYLVWCGRTGGVESRMWWRSSTSGKRVWANRTRGGGIAGDGS